MAGIKITDLDSVVGVPADSDVLVIVDISTNVTKQISVKDLLSASTETNATTLTVNNTTTNTSFYITYTDVFNGSSTSIFSNSNLSYNPSTSTLSASYFSGDGSGLTNVTAISSGTSTNVAVTEVTTGVYYPALIGTAGGNQPVRYDTGITYDAITDTLNAGYFIGDGSGLTNLNLGAGTAATTITVGETANDATHYITFVDVTDGNDSCKTDGSLTYNPYTDTLSAGFYDGNGEALTNVNALKLTVSNSSINASRYLTFTTLASGIDSVNTNANLRYNPSTGTISATAFVGSGSALTGVNGTSLTVGTSAVDTSHYLLFSATSSGTDSVNTDTALTYNPNTNVLTAGSFFGNGSGLTNISNITSNATSFNATHYPLFSGTLTGNDSANTNSNLTYNPSTGTFTATAFVGNGSAVTDVTAKNITTVGKTNNAVLNVLFSGTATSRSNGVLYTDSVGVSNNITYNPSTNTLTVGNVDGTVALAEISKKVSIRADMSSSSGLEVLFVKPATTRIENELYQDSVYVAEGLTYTPLTETLTSGFFVGDGSGLTNVTSATATLATNAISVGVTAVSTNTEHFLHFGTGTSGYDSVNVDIDLIYNPSQNALKLDADGASIRLGEDSDLIITHNGTNGYINVKTGSLYVRDGLDSIHSLFDIATGDLHVEGNVISYSTTIVSDPKLKHEIKPLENSLSRIKELNGVSWKWKSDNTASAGVISTDVKKVLPEAVSIRSQLNSEETFESVNYDAIIGLLIEAIKDLSSQVEKLKSSGCDCNCKI